MGSAEDRNASRALNLLGLAAGVAGLVTVIPVLEAVGAVFGVGLIVWFVWIGVILLQNGAGRPADVETRAERLSAD